MRKRRAKLSECGGGAAAFKAALPRRTPTADTPLPWSFARLPVFSGGGESLPYRDRIARSFGDVDLDGVRAHAGPDASAFARSLDARAVTIGSDIAFDGRPSLFTAAHEAAHAVQPQDDEARDERNADQVASEVVAGRSSAHLLRFRPAASSPLPLAVRRQPAGAQTQPSNPLAYNRDNYKIEPPSKDWTYEEVKRRLTIYFKTVTTVGATTKQDEFFLEYALYSIASHLGTSTETDVIGPTSFAPDPAGSKTTPTFARMTFRIDKDTNATAELIGAGTAPASPKLTSVDAIATLKKKHGFVSVRDDGTASWSDAELSDVVDALALIPTADADALKGVELIRVASLGPHSAEFSSAGGVAKGATKVSALPFLKVANDAFVDPKMKFIGGAKKSVPAVYNVLLHEVGHAVEKQAYRKQAESLSQATIDLNAAIAAKKPAAETSALAKARKPKEAALAATQVGQAAAKPSKDEAKAAKKTAADEIAALKAKIKTMSTAAVLLTADYAAGIDAVSAAIVTLEGAEPAKVAAAEKAVEDAQKDRDAKRLASFKTATDELTNTIIFEFDSARRAEDLWYDAARMAIRVPHRTKRLQRFVDLVTKLGIEPFTDYARANWPFNPAEFYAEAYSLYLTDNEYLKKNYPDVVTFFDGARD